MKKIILTAASLLLLTSAGIGYAVNANTDGYETPVTESGPPLNKEAIQSDVAGISSFEELDTLDQITAESIGSETVERQMEYEEFAEYTELANQVGVINFDIQVVEDNKHKRVMLLKDSLDQPQYKSIYVKNKKRLKIVDFKDGLVFDQVLSDVEKNVDAVDNVGEYASKEEKTKAPLTELEGFSEYAELANQIDVTNFNVQVAEDNEGKRIILLKDGNGKPQYKSIYVKDENRLKIINLRGGLLYNGTI